jgi:CubicO group peptidase (beta-lactamase class C family)
MRRACAALLIAVVCAVNIQSPAKAQSLKLAEDGDVAAYLRLYEIWVQEQMAYYHQPGVSIGIVYDQDLVWAKGFGYRDVAHRLSATTGTVYRIASITKTFTATAILQLRDAGKLQLDDPVRKHLGWFEYRDRFPDAPAVTIRHLLTHTSGLPREADFPYWSDPDSFPTREEMIAALENQESVFEPETRYKYSNLALALAGEIVAAVSGEPYADYIQRHVVDPLGMTSTTVRTEDIDRENLAPAANMSSTVEDLARYVSLQFRRGPADGAQILKGSTLREMHRVHWLDPDWSSGRGLGFGVWRQGTRTLVGHGGWVGGYRTQIAFDPKSRVGVVVLTNSDEGGPGAYVRQAFDIVAPAIEKAAAEKAAVVSLPDLDRYIGTYHDPDGWVTDVLVLDERLVIYGHGYPPSANPKGSLTELTHESGHTFRLTGESGNGERVIFEMAEGKVARVKVGANYIFPEGCGRIERLRCTWR